MAERFSADSTAATSEEMPPTLSAAAWMEPAVLPSVSEHWARTPSSSASAESACLSMGESELTVPTRRPPVFAKPSRALLSCGIVVEAREDWRSASASVVAWMEPFTSFASPVTSEVAPFRLSEMDWSLAMAAFWESERLSAMSWEAESLEEISVEKSLLPPIHGMLAVTFETEPSVALTFVEVPSSAETCASAASIWPCAQPIWPATWPMS